MKTGALVLFIAALSLALHGCLGFSEARDHNAAAGKLWMEGQTEAAIAEYDEANRLDPGLASAYAGRAAAYNDLDRYQKAIKDS